MLMVNVTAKKFPRMAQIGIVVHNIIVEPVERNAYVNPKSGMRSKEYNSLEKFIKNDRAYAGIERTYGACRHVLSAWLKS